MRNLLLLLTFIFISVPHAVSAQETTIPMEQNDISAKTPKKSGEPTNSEEFVKSHFKKCLARDHLSLSDKQVESICSCSAANLNETLSFEEMKLMTKSSDIGKEARQKFLAYAYAPCLKYLVADISKNDCLGSELAKNIKIGKLNVCKCVEKKMVSIFERQAPSFMIEAVAQNPMTLDPVDNYFSSEGYISQRDGYIKECIYNTAYKRDNK